MTIKPFVPGWSVLHAPTRGFLLKEQGTRRMCRRPGSFIGALSGKRSGAFTGAIRRRCAAPGGTAAMRLVNLSKTDS